MHHSTHSLRIWRTTSATIPTESSIIDQGIGCQLVSTDAQSLLNLSFWQVQSQQSLQESFDSKQRKTNLLPQNPNLNSQLVRDLVN